MLHAGVRVLEVKQEGRMYMQHGKPCFQRRHLPKTLLTQTGCYAAGEHPAPATACRG